MEKQSIKSDFLSLFPQPACVQFSLIKPPVCQKGEITGLKLKRLRNDSVTNQPGATGKSSFYILSFPLLKAEMTGFVTSKIIAALKP